MERNKRENIRQKSLSEQLLLYAITPAYGDEEEYFRSLEGSLRGGVRILQLREKHLPKEKLEELAIRVKRLCDRYGVPLIVNDDPYLAQRIDAAGVHLGQGDLDLDAARKIVGDKIIVVSSHNVKEAIAAERSGADYLGAGACFDTPSKSNIIPIELGELNKITAAVDIPVVAIGGITHGNVERLNDRGLSGVAVISALFAAKDVERVTREFLRRLKL